MIAALALMLSLTVYVEPHCIGVQVPTVGGYVQCTDRWQLSDNPTPTDPKGTR